MGYLRIIIKEQDFKIFFACHLLDYSCNLSFFKNYHDNMVTIPVIIW
jgi:hypothetical protein